MKLGKCGHWYWDEFPGCPICNFLWGVIDNDKEGVKKT